MRWQRIGDGPILTRGLGRLSSDSRKRIPSPPQKSTTFISLILPSPFREAGNPYHAGARNARIAGSGPVGTSRRWAPLLTTATSWLAFAPEQRPLGLSKEGQIRNITAASGLSDPRILILSQRSYDLKVYQMMTYEFEDVIAAIDDVAIL